MTTTRATWPAYGVDTRCAVLHPSHVRAFRVAAWSACGLALALIAATPAIAAPAKAGARCAKVGATAVDAQGRTLVCTKTKKAKKPVWVLQSAPAAPTGPPYEWSGSWDRGWQQVRPPQPCPTELSRLFTRLPFDLADVTSIRRPGYANPQSGYKPHAHVRYAPDDADGRQVIVAPADGWLYAAGRYREAYTPGNDQVILDFFAECGVMWRFDHLRDGTLAPALATAIAGVEVREDSRTTRVTPVFVRAGDPIATGVGATSCEVGRPLCLPPGGPNLFVDFGVYDPRALNDAARRDPSYLGQSQGESFKGIALCWLDLFPASRSALERVAEGESDYCREA